MEGELMYNIQAVKKGFFIKLNKGEVFMKRVLLICLVVVLITGGIFAVTKYYSHLKAIPPNAAVPAKGDQVNSEQQEKLKEVNLFYTNNKYIESEDESQPKVISIIRKVNYDKMTLAEAAVRELQKKPTAEGLVTSIPDEAKLLSVDVKEGMAYVNFSSEGLNGGSLEEMLTINQIVSTLLNINGINSVRFLKDGQPADDLMGHADTSEPFYKKKDIKIEELQLGDMKLYVKKDEFLKKFGEPTLIRTGKTDNVKYFDYSDFKATVTDGEVSEISTTSDKFVTPSGLKVGDTEERAMSIYGEPSSAYRGTLNYKVGHEYELLHIKVKDKKVIEIRVNLAD
jgi:hypothetical protein